MSFFQDPLRRTHFQDHSFRLRQPLGMMCLGVASDAGVADPVSLFMSAIFRILTQDYYEQIYRVMSLWVREKGPAHPLRLPHEPTSR